MPKKKKTSICLMVDSEIWNKTKNYSGYIGIEKGDIVGSALKLYFKTLDKIETDLKNKEIVC